LTAASRRSSTAGSVTATRGAFGQRDRSCRKNARYNVVPDLKEKEACCRPRHAKGDAREDVREVVHLEVEAAEADDPDESDEGDGASRPGGCGCPSREQVQDAP